ncbi:hypothetical protein OsJ_02303 [Oryza sativa Japonica Group]|uniref:Uncharacterized protein n=1 Tax=Oryza sativa subsp. japonica TaxID=39947 RepID=B9EXN0_ORYSJ|nr:hypothetical protein OsJ_02303 [Oryza sativa Japonica Group]
MCTTTSSPSKPNWRSTLLQPPPTGDAAVAALAQRARPDSLASTTSTTADDKFGPTPGTASPMQSTSACTPRPSRWHHSRTSNTGRPTTRPGSTTATPSWAPHMAIDVYEADALAVVDPVSGIQGVGVLVNQELDRRLAHGASAAAAAAGVQLPGQHPPPQRATSSRIAGREETIVYEADPDALAVDLVDDRSVGG